MPNTSTISSGMHMHLCTHTVLRPFQLSSLSTYSSHPFKMWSWAPPHTSFSFSSLPIQELSHSQDFNHHCYKNRLSMFIPNAHLQQLARHLHTKVSTSFKPNTHQCPHLLCPEIRSLSQLSLLLFVTASFIYLV